MVCRKYPNLNSNHALSVHLILSLATLSRAPDFKFKVCPRRRTSTPAAFPTTKTTGSFTSNFSVVPARIRREINLTPFWLLISTHVSSRSLISSAFRGSISAFGTKAGVAAGETAADATGAVTVDLRTTVLTASGAGVGTDTLVDVENVIGSNYSDTFIGDTEKANEFRGGTNITGSGDYGPYGLFKYVILFLFK